MNKSHEITQICLEHENKITMKLRIQLFLLFTIESKRKGARTEETGLTPKLKKFQLQYSTGSDFLCFFTVFFQIKAY